MKERKKVSKRNIIIYFIMAIVLTIGVGVILKTVKDNVSAESVVLPEEEYRIVCTNFPAYDWVRALTKGDGQAYKISLIRDDVYTGYKPDAEDVALISEADMLIYTGSECDLWVSDVMNTVDLKKDDIKCVSLTQILSEGGIDDPIGDYPWLSIKNAEILINGILKEISAIRPEASDIYKQNFSEYKDELLKLDLKFSYVTNYKKSDVIYFIGSFPFDKLFKEYGIICDVISDDVPYKDMLAFADKANEYDIQKAGILRGADTKTLEMLNDTSGRGIKPITFDPMGIEPEKESYLNIMEENYQMFESLIR